MVAWKWISQAKFSLVGCLKFCEIVCWQTLSLQTTQIPDIQDFFRWGGRRNPAFNRLVLLTAVRFLRNGSFQMAAGKNTSTPLMQNIYASKGCRKLPGDCAFEVFEIRANCPSPVLCSPCPRPFLTTHVEQPVTPSYFIQPILWELKPECLKSFSVRHEKSCVFGPLLVLRGGSTEIFSNKPKN